MFLRKIGIHKDGKEHGYWSLVETVRTADGPRQRTLCYLGELHDSTCARWQKTVEVFNEHGESSQLKLFSSEAEAPDDPNVARVLVKKVRVERTRRFGDCYLGLELKANKDLGEATRASVKKEMAKPHMAKSARIAERGTRSLEFKMSPMPALCRHNDEISFSTPILRR